MRRGEVDDGCHLPTDQDLDCPVCRSLPAQLLVTDFEAHVDYSLNAGLSMQERPGGEGRADADVEGGSHVGAAINPL